MKRIVLWLASTATVVVLLFGYRTSTNDTSAATMTNAESSYAATTSAASSGSTPTSSGALTGTSTSGSSGTTSGSASTTFTGSAVQTQWGPVQVQITVAAGQITAVDVLQFPQGNNKDQQINARALPILVQDTISAQSAKIDMVSGATVTSTGYLQSLQSALDQAGI
jgi:uncharacterized protein with FMN-binding domain